MTLRKRLPAASAACVCGSGRDYGDCCGPWHLGLDEGRHAPTPEALMRSRYAAYAIGLPDYLMATWHGSSAPGDLELQAIKWLGLDVREAHSSGDAGIVEFVARYRDSSGRGGRLHEISRFVREAGRWYYIDGSFVGE